MDHQKARPKGKTENEKEELHSLNRRIEFKIVSN
jgi:hypothetical protein